MTTTTLYLQIEGDMELEKKYIEHIKTHNEMIVNSKYPSSGFDIFYPSSCNKEIIGTIHKLDFKIKCMMVCNGVNTGFYMYPRSGLSLTPLRLANCVGIIDAGYRNNITGYFDLLSSSCIIKKYHRLVQICSPNLKPFNVLLTNNIN